MTAAFQDPFTPPPGYRLRLPGPTEVPEAVRAALARPMINHRGPEFRAMLAATEALIRPVLGTANPVVFLAGSGTAAMEATLANILAPAERVLVASHGQFGERFAEIARSLGAQVDLVEFTWGEAPDPAVVAEKLREADYGALLVTHNESSTGAVADLAALGRLVQGTRTLLVTDSVSGLAGLEMRQDEWGVDVVVSASQKALMCPPGLGLISLSERARARVMRNEAMPRFFFDLRKALANAEKHETPFTPSVSHVAGLHVALTMIAAETLPKVLARHRRLADALRAGGAAMGLGEFTRAAHRSSTVVVFEVPARLQGGDIVRLMYQRHATVIAGARNRLQGKVIRIGVMGGHDEGTILTDLMQLESVLRELGHAVAPGAGVAAAAAFLGSLPPPMARAAE
ncbi:alanine--glyoxylate aminotransferase family protein [Roseococcus sp. SYP-B2431]|uniref:pyridoxal-phosphate-dependent aminotransferase family protein n=1 Tax=Roseococcus sp. SYP-B2431 TaxID=2496640 RepID=UPI00103CE269|nr:alanine--glyoxylate aminotransferase family protein [Roseococcus sp. SYP-B2431]TCH96001.1 alanine--glyoxylate aminotransferase family protein [Roseococcus sp. SYP-B2431]